MFIDDFFLGQELEFTKTLQELAVEINVSAFLICAAKPVINSVRAHHVSSGTVTHWVTR